MPKPNIIIVHLRQPVSSKDQREDPFWEVGSFGCTGCKRKTLLNPNQKRNRIDILNGSQFAFAQGGPKGMKLVFLTPPVEIIRKKIKGKTKLEAQWKPHTMPFRYETAPLLADNNGKTDFPGIKSLLGNVNRSTWSEKFSSKFRSGVQPLPGEVSEEIKAKLKEKFSKAPRAKSYLDAIPDLGYWKEHIRKTKGWTRKDRLRAHNELCADGTCKPCRSGKRGC